MSKVKKVNIHRLFSQDEIGAMVSKARRIAPVIEDKHLCHSKEDDGLVCLLEDMADCITDLQLQLKDAKFKLYQNGPFKITKQ